MALKTKVDYFGLATAGFEVSDTAENRSIGYTAEARGDDNFLVAIDAGGENIAPSCDYTVTSSASLANVVLGSVTTIDDKAIALGSISITTQAGQAPKMSATGSQIEDGGSAHCTATCSGVTLSPLYHAQDFGLFTVTGGQLQQSTLTYSGDIATTMIDGVIKSSDLVGAAITVSGTIVGVGDDGKISTPTITLKTPTGNVLAGVITQPLSETNSNGEYPTYAFTAMWGVKADAA